MLSQENVERKQRALQRLLVIFLSIIVVIIVIISIGGIFMAITKPKSITLDFSRDFDVPKEFISSKQSKFDKAKGIPKGSSVSSIIGSGAPQDLNISGASNSIHAQDIFRPRGRGSTICE